MEEIYLRNPEVKANKRKPDVPTAPPIPLDEKSCDACEYLPVMRACPRCGREVCRDCMRTHICVRYGRGASPIVSQRFGSTEVTDRRRPKRTPPPD